jgi:ATP-dependent DNA helicase PIF1
MSKKMYYAVAVGHNPGIYTDWSTANENVKGYSGAVYEKFKTLEEAEEYIQKNDKTTKTEKTDILRIDMLTTEQLTVFSHLLKDENILLTGGGGVGKSFLLSVLFSDYPGLKKTLQTSINPDIVAKLPRIQMCALTGCAALLLGNKAKTLHSWAGIGLGKGTVSELYVKIRRNQKAMRNWLCTDMLIIDEISMMTAELFDKLNELAKKIRGNKKPFGGIQLLLVGDFYQLPPVNKGDGETQFIFEAASWRECIGHIVELTQIQRQKDEVFQRVLKEARIGALSKESCEILSKCMGREWKKNKIRPTLIFPRRAEVEMINDTNLRGLTGRRYTYKARLVYDGKSPDGFSETNEHFMKVLQMFDTDAAYSKELELMLNAQVMLVANTNPELGLVNGSRGIIIGFCASTELPIVEFINGVKKTVGPHMWPIEDYEFVSRSQIPLRLAYAITCHRTQGSTLDSALVDIGAGIFEYGQAYVALSRVKSLEALYVHDFDPMAFRAHPKVKKFYKDVNITSVCDEDIQFIQKVREDLKNNTEKPVISAESRPILAINVIKQGAEIDTDNWLYNSIPDEWKDCLVSCKENLLKLSTSLSTKEFIPSRERIWKALELTSIKNIKVVILGQDPFPNEEHACGLAFSVLDNVRPFPASLRNIYKELVSDIGIETPKHGNLESWAKQGVLLLNTVLTVESGNPQSHSKLGWEEVTDQIIRTIASKSEKVVFVLWGKSAQAKKKLINSEHHIIESAHPSPLSASRGFFGSKPFSKVNALMAEMGKECIDWRV